MQITVIGAGNMGSIHGANLARIGAQVTLVDVLEEHVDSINEHGLRMDGVDGEYTVHLPATTDPAAVPLSDVAFICVLGYQTREAAQTAKAVLKDDGFAITLQNGLGNLEVLLEVLGHGRVVGGLAYHSADTRGPGQVSHTKKGVTYLGELDRTRTPRVEALAELLEQAGMQPQISDDILTTIWNKFVLNCAVNALCAVTNLRPWNIQEVPELDQFQTGIITEVLALAKASGIRLPDPDPLATIKAHSAKGSNRPSMMQHIARGQPTEIDTLNGHVVRESERLGLQAPCNDALTRLVKGRQHAPQRQSPE